MTEATLKMAIFALTSIAAIALVGVILLTVFGLGASPTLAVLSSVATGCVGAVAGLINGSR